ncbi:hypothetical protein [Streptomyces sp. TLI_146]|uniref:hypothetical protein n=1 Tax=Streptomyces sp. TLI_146 TaxID=1938858 RepID=UPI000C712E55|nr:hypothetical protein [Streptomyces sp. TLI_146]PKV86497.1 hypothetical protein BX283_4063 [Streptomyces sp. TLI_146]
MAVTDELRNALTDPKPLFFVAGALDLGAKQAAKVPEKIPVIVERLQTEVPARVEAVRKTDPKVVQDKVVAQAKEAQAVVTAKVTEVVGALDGDVKKLGDSVQHLALQAVGFAAESLVKAREGYDKVAERGQEVVKEWRGEAAEEILEVAEAIEPKGSGTSTSEPEAPAGDSSDSSDSSAEAKPASARKTTARKSTAKKTAAKPAE